MKKISKVAALLAASALLFGGMFLSCSDSDDGDSTGGGSGTTKPTPTPTPTPDPETPGDSLVYNMDNITITDEGTVGQKVLFDGGLTVVNSSAGKIKITANSAGTHHYIQASCGANSLGALSSQTGYLKVKASKAGTEKITFTFTTVKSTKGESENYIYLIDENSQELGRSSVINCPTTDSDTELTREIQATVPEYFYVVFVRGAGSGGFKFTKIEQVAIAKAKSSQTAPAVANFAATACTTSAQNDGKITISNETAANLEYKLSTADSYSDVTGSTIENLAAGTYLFRYKETDDNLASDPIEVVVKKWVDTSVYFTKFDAKELYGDATEAVNVEADKTAADGTWELTIASGKKAQVKAGEFKTYDYDEATSKGYKWTNRLSFNKQGADNVALKLKVGAAKQVILRVDGGSVKDLSSNVTGESNLTFKGAGDAISWNPVVSLSTTYVTVTGDADGYVTINSTDTTNGANIYGITVVESAVDTSVIPFETSLTTPAKYGEPTVTGLTAPFVYEAGSTITAVAAVEVTPSTTTQVMVDGSLGTVTNGTESVADEDVKWTATPLGTTNSITLGTGKNLSFATSADKIGTYVVNAAYTVGEVKYTSDDYQVQITEAGAKYHTVTFYNGTEPIGGLLVKAGDKVPAPTETPEKGGYTFAGWVTENNGTTEFDFNTATADNTDAINIYAKWTENSGASVEQVEAGEYSFSKDDKGTYPVTKATALIITGAKNIDSSGLNLTSKDGEHGLVFTLGKTMVVTLTSKAGATFNAVGKITTSDGSISVKAGGDADVTVAEGNKSATIAVGSSATMTLSAGTYELLGNTTSSFKVLKVKFE